MKTPHIPRKMLIVGALGVAAAVGVGAAGSAGAQTGDGTTTTTTKPAGSAKGEGMRCDGPKREQLDEATAAKVKAAAEKAVPGATLQKSGHDRDDGYVAMLLKADGTTRVLVHLDQDFKVTNIEDPAPTRKGHREPLDAATAAKVKAAAEKAVDGATVKKSGHDRDDGYVAMLLKADGTTRVLVHLDKDFKVTDVQDPAPNPPGPRGGPGRGHRGGPMETAPAEGASTSV